MRRGDIILAAIQGDYGKVRPAVIVQSDLFNGSHPSIILCPFTSEMNDFPVFRLTVHPSPENGLREISQIMVDKVMVLPKKRLRERIGSLEENITQELNICLRLILGFAGG